MVLNQNISGVNYVGGIAGNMSGTSYTYTAIVCDEPSSNIFIQGTEYVGGVAGLCSGGFNSYSSFTVKNVDITGQAGSGRLGGVFGKHGYNNARATQVSNIVVDNIAISGPGGYMQPDSSNPVGAVAAYGGVFGLTELGFSITSADNLNITSSTSAVGLVAGVMDIYSCDITISANVGTARGSNNIITGAGLVGGIAGWLRGNHNDGSRDTITIKTSSIKNSQITATTNYGAGALFGAAIGFYETQYIYSNNPAPIISSSQMIEIENCSFEAKDGVAGAIGVWCLYGSNKINVKVGSCSVNGSNFVGGVVGIVSGGDSKTDLLDGELLCEQSVIVVVLLEWLQI